MSANIQFKRGTASTFHSLNPVLLRGEPGLEIDTNKIKYGDGVTPWRNLPYGNPALEVVDGGGLFAPSFSPAPGTFSPADITGLSLWMDSDKADYVHVVNNRVSVWEDMSQTRAQFFQSNKANRPSFSNQILDQNVITFDGVNDAMIGKFDLPEEFTLVIAVKRRGEATNGKILSAYSTDGSEEMVLCGIEAGGDLGVGDGADYFATQSTDDLVTVVYTLQYTSDGLSTRLNGLNTQAGDIPGTLQKTTLSIGADRADFAEGNFSGDIAEIVIYDGILGAANLLDIENYMMERWGIVQVSHPLLEGMKAFWPLNEESGNRIDITAGEIPLVPTGTVGFEAGVIGNAAKFTGGSNYLQAPADFTLAGAFSVSLWFKPESVTGSSPQIIQNWTAGTQGQMVLGFGDEGTETGVIWGYVRTANSNYRVSAPDLEANRWYHVALVFDQTNNKLLLYVDGVLADQAATAGTLATSNIPLRVGIGEQTSAPNTVAFLADQLGIWDRVLTLADIQMLYNDELGKEDFTADLYGDNVSLLLHMDKPANAVGASGGGSGTLTNGLLAFWPLNETSGQRLDISGNARHLADSDGAALAIGTGGATGSVSGKIGNAAEFTGDAGAKVLRLGVPLPAYETPTGTVAAWVKLNSLTEGRVIAGDYYRTPLSLWFEPNDGAFYGKLSGNQISISHPATSGAWCHLVFTYDHATKTGEFFVNGTNVGTQTYSDPYTPVVNAGGFAVGSTGDGYPNHFIAGLVDAVGVWDRVLTQTEVLELYNNGLGTETLAGNTDPDFNNVALLLHMDGANNSTTAADASKNGTDFTANNGAVISTTQSKFGGASCYFPGANSTLTGPDVGLGTDKFTLELWFKAESGGGPQYATLFANYEVSTSSSGFGLYYNNDGAGAGGVGLYSYYGICASTNAFADNLWHHVAVTRDGDNCKLFVDGVLEGTGTTTSGRSFSSPDGIMLGGSPEIGGRHFNGYIDEVRITKGVVRYTANFTPPTAEFPLGPIKTVTMPTVETALLLHMDGASFVDSGENKLAVTANGAVVSTAQSKFGGASGYFGWPSTSDYLTIQTPHGITFGTDDFTFECWFYLTETTGFVAGKAVLISNTDTWQPNCFDMGISDANFGGAGTLTAAVNNGTWLNGTTAVAPNVWHHFAFTRQGSSWRLFLDGVLESEVTQSISLDGGVERSLRIGATDNGNVMFFPGYIDELRITKGAALYATNFTPPAAPFLDPQPAPALLVNFDSGIADLSSHAHVLNNTSVATSSAIAASFGPAGSFDGSSSRLVIPDAPEFDLSSGPFCIEARFYATNLAVDINSGNQVLISKDQYGVNYSWAIWVSQTQIASATANIAGDWDFFVQQAVTQNEWHHIALTGDGSTMKMFFDGVLVGTKNRTLTNGSASVTIGCGAANNPNSFFGGYIDNVRVVKGSQVYTSNFTPPTASLLPPAVTPAPDLLLHFDGTTFTDSGKNQLTVTKNGNAAISAAQSKFGGASGHLTQSNLDKINFNEGAGNNFLFSGDFTIEFWLYAIDINSDNSLMFVYNGSTYLAINVDLSNYNIYLNSGSPTVSGSHDISLNQWTHVALVRSGNTVTVYTDGIAKLTSTNSAPLGYANPVKANIGGDGSPQEFYVDEFRIVNGTALYTANFNPPAAPFQNPIITITQPATGLASGLEAFWKFDNLTDSTGNGHDLVDVNYTTIAPGKIGGALTVNANGGLQYAKISNFKILRATGFSVSGWIKSTDPTQSSPPFAISHGVPFGFCDGSMVTLEYGTFNAGNNPCFGPTSTAIQILNPAAVQDGLDGNWHHLVGTFDGSVGKFYVDGVLIGTQAGVTMDDTWPVPDTYFGSGMAEYARTGQVDAVAYWTRALTESEVLALYNNGNGTETLTGGGGGGSTGPITTFIDSSKHNHALAAVGNAHLNLTDIKYGSGSGEFAGGHCTVPMSPEFALGAGDFTVEFWGKLSYAANSAVFSIAPTAQEAGTYLIGFRNDPNMFGFCYDMPNFTFVSADISAQYGAWAHYAFVRLDGVLKMYVNGTQVGTANTTIDLDGGTQTTAVVGRRWVDQDDYYLNGLIDELRITKGVARYIANFNPPAKAFPDPVLVAPPAPVGDPYAEYVTLLLHMDGANGSSTFTENSYLQNTVTANGSVISTAQSKFGGASGYFDGATSYLSAAELQLGTHDFTIEAWIYPVNLTNAGAILNQGDTDSTGNFLFLIESPGIIVFYADNFPRLIGTTNVSTNQWSHVALVRSGSTYALFVNGVADGTYTGTHNHNGSPFKIGDGFGGVRFFDGYIDEVRITKGVARYTANFVPPTEAFLNPFAPSADATLLMHFDGANGSTTFVDSSANARTVTANGNAQISTAQSKFGGASLALAGTGTLVVASSNDFAFESGDFTVEAWVFLNNTDGPQHIMEWRNYDENNSPAWYIFNGNVRWYVNSADRISASANIMANQWHHLAVCRNSGITKLFIDGVQSGSDFADDTNYQVNPTNRPLIGGYGPSTAVLNGYIDELRIVKGQAVYTANFTPPTAPFTPTAAVTPTDITGCDLWLDSTGDIATVNGSIVTWSDKSGNGRTATPADYAPAPVVAAGDGPNGQPVVRFSGDPNVLDVSYQFNLKNSSGFILLKQPATINYGPAYPRILGFQPTTGLDSDANDGMALVFNNDVPTDGIELWSVNPICVHQTQLPIDWTLIAYTIDASGNATLRLDGVQVATGANTAMTNKAAGNLYIGHGGGFMLGDALQGDIAEIALFDHELGEAALVGLERGIMRRWFPQVAPAAQAALLLHFDGTNGSTTFTDSSSNALSVTANGNAAISTAQSKFGGASGYFDGTSFIHTPNNPQFLFGSGDFTIEAQIFFPTLTGGINSICGVWDFNPQYSWLFTYDNGLGLRLYWSENGVSGGVFTRNWTPSENQWYHVALVRQAGQMSVYVDGVKLGESELVNATFNASSTRLTIGAAGNDGHYFNGYIDELRIVKGTAVYTSNFTPPTSPFPDAWTPAQLGSSLSLWLDADDSDSVVSVGGVVSQWSDKSGQNNHATPSLSYYSPNVSANGLNGRDAISFTKSSVHHLITPTISGNGIANAQSISIIQVIVPTTGWFNTYCSSVGTRNSGGSWWSFQRNNASNEFGFHGAAQYWSGFNINGNAALLVDVVTGGFTLNSWANGSQVQTNLPIGPFTSSTSDPMVIGAGSQVESGEAFDGLIAEIIFLPSAISNENRQKMEGYLAWKWGLVSSLPSDHPYKTSFPTTP